MGTDMPEQDTNAEDSSNNQSQTPLVQAQTTLHLPMTEEQIQASHVGVLAPLAQPIQIVDYDPMWPQLFAREAARIQVALGDRILLLEHVGSTSVPNLAAKPKIDMLLVLVNSANEP